LLTVKEQKRVQIGTYQGDVGEAGRRFDIAMQNIVDNTKDFPYMNLWEAL
jgi:hypothetical protein